MVTEQEVARGSAEAMLAGDAAAKLLGISLADVGAGRARMTMEVRPDMVNGHDLCHGGVITTLADTAFAVACNSHGTVAVASGIQVDFLEPARLGDLLEADAREVVVRGRSGICDVTVRRGETVIAEFRGRSRSLGTPIQP